MKPIDALRDRLTRIAALAAGEEPRAKDKILALCEEALAIEPQEEGTILYQGRLFPGLHVLRIGPFVSGNVLLHSHEMSVRTTGHSRLTVRGVNDGFTIRTASIHADSGVEEDQLATTLPVRRCTCGHSFENHGPAEAPGVGRCMDSCGCVGFVAALSASDRDRVSREFDARLVVPTGLGTPTDPGTAEAVRGILGRRRDPPRA